jgi:hypothetical protein
MRAAFALAVLLAFGALVPASGSASVRLPDCGSSSFGGRVAPRKWDYGCTEVWDLIRTHWHHWGHGPATGRGRHQLDDCNPNCAEGTVKSYPARARAFRIRWCYNAHGLLRRFYTRVRISYSVPAHNPFGLRRGRHKLLYRLRCE